ncbi:hypothetical protein F4X10_15375 [Candidatus Poribacteria bacterium]|nr:hypothetical protein [Candidatus Poribacteria bacterium]
MSLFSENRIRLTGVCVFKQDSLIKNLGIWWTMFATIRTFDSVPIFSNCDRPDVSLTTTKETMATETLSSDTGLGNKKVRSQKGGN